MNKIDQILAYVKSITERLNAWAANAKKVEELPEMETVNSEALMMVSELEEGVWTSKKLEIQKIIDGISLAGQNNTVREVLLGEITAEHDLEYLFDNNAISVSPTELVILIVFQTISSKQIQRQFLWKLGKGDFAPIGSADLPTKVLELQPKYINEIIADELISAPDAIVYDFGTITDSIIDEVNAAILAFDFTDDEKIYYLRFTQDDIKYLYNFVGTNGSYGDSELQMDESDLVLVYSSEITDVVSLIQSLSNFYLSETTNDASGNKSGSIYRPGKLGVGTSPLLGKLEILIDNLYSTNVAGILNGVIGFGNDSNSGLAPTIFSRSNNSIGLSFISGTNDTNGTDDMRWDIRKNDNTDFDTLSGGGFRWTRYNVNLMQLFRTGVLKIFGLAGTGSRIVEADSTGVLSATRSLDDYYTKTEVDSKVSSLYKIKGSVANYASLPSSGNVVGDAWNLLDTGMNYVWTGSVWDALGTTVDISGKEDISNKTDDIEANKTSSSKYGSAKGIWDLIVAKCVQITNIKTVNGNSLVGTGNIVTPDMDTTTAQDVTGVKTFRNGMIALRNVANTFSITFTNAITAARSVTWPDKSGTVAMTSDITSSLSGTTNKLTKFTSPNVVGDSRVIDDGVSLGVGIAVSQNKDITIGRGANRSIGVEQSDNTTEGYDLTVEAGKTTNVKELPAFSVYYNTSAGYWGICKAPNGDIYVSVAGGDIYKQTGGTGSFVALGEPTANYAEMASAPNGDIYVVNTGIGAIYKQTGGTGAFVSLGLPARAYQGICVAPNGDVYTTVDNGDIYKQTGGTGSFVALGQTSRTWRGICISPKGDVYSIAQSVGVYKQTGATGTFTLVPNTVAGIGVAVNSNDDIYMSVNGSGDIYKQTAGIGKSIAVSGLGIKNWRQIIIDSLGNIYATVYSGLVYSSLNTAGTTNLKGGTLKLKAGMGKGNAPSRTQIITGQKTVSGTDMQVEQVVVECDENGKTTFNGVIKLKGYTVATLPTGSVGDTAYVTDASSPAFLSTVVGGGSVKCRVFYDGTNWIVN